MGTAASLVLTEPDLYLGGTAIFGLLNEYGIQASLSLGDQRPKESTGIDVLHFEIADSPEQEIRDLLAEGIEFILRHRLEGKVVLVHCRAGVSRSASFLLAYLMTIFQWDRDQATRYLVKCRRAIGPNSGFMRALRDFELDHRDDLRAKLEEKYGSAFHELVEKDTALSLQMELGKEHSCDVDYETFKSCIGVHSSQTVDFLLRVSKQRFIDEHLIERGLNVERLSIWHGKHLSPEDLFSEIDVIDGLPFVLIDKEKNPLDDPKFSRNHGHHFDIDVEEEVQSKDNLGSESREK